MGLSAGHGRLGAGGSTPEEFVFLLLGRELLSGGVPVWPWGLSKTSSKGAWLLLPLALPARREAAVPALRGGAILPRRCHTALCWCSEC